MKNKEDLHDNYLVIYYNEEKTVHQTVRPTKQFNGRWKELADAVSGSDANTRRYYNYEVK